MFKFAATTFGSGRCNMGRVVIWTWNCIVLEWMMPNCTPRCSSLSPSIGFFILRYIWHYLTNNWQKLMAFVLTFPSTWTFFPMGNFTSHLKLIFHLRPGIFFTRNRGHFCATDVTDKESPKKIELSTRLYDDVSICHYQWELTLSNLFIFRKVLCYPFFGGVIVVTDIIWQSDRSELGS